MYTQRNFKTKKELKQAVAEWNEYAARGFGENNPARSVRYYQPGPFGGNEPQNGEFSIEGPHYPKAHTWYARVRAENGVIVKVLG